MEQEFNQAAVIDAGRDSDGYVAGFHQFTLDGYIEFIVRFVEQLNPSIVIERFSGEIPPKYMTVQDAHTQHNAPSSWNAIRYDAVLRLIEKELERQDTWQGKYYT
jgi:radical SAM superfamily enzyme